ncbi:dolichyl-phosphate-mannose--protein O-mannosyl transferase [[Phormidium ambiguum] IAM M-71]|uniref:Polyprenol-phosphate-mannose--protein mannosyltransferase n=1 Tax=[Phormidium ambiguum] IAM M-71 TaxID=454136 RepID=A0A1U7I2E3_9CYAN|nr:phospholipid carrier-dependent glycosyltransferase [Phormidium ambiguum]OKH30259.1 dolichyl-phosphate-mannose--protein O-mannosyl transferase [Phormidium ambiguum IAM M-71]
MKLAKQNSQLSLLWFSFGMLAIMGLSFALHFWGLGRFNMLVFDEIYYVKYGNNYLINQPHFDAHPPLGKYMIAVGMWLGSHVLGKDLNSLSNTAIYPWVYRWMNAFVGSLFPAVVGGIAYLISQRRSYTLIASLFMAVDGLFLVESRYALINIYLVMFGLLGHLFFLIALANRGNNRQVWLFFSGISLGASVAVKWNGLAFLLGIYILWGLAWFLQVFPRNYAEDVPEISSQQFKFRQVKESIFKNLTEVNFLQVTLFLAVIPAIVYALLWIPHLEINKDTNFVKVHQQMLGFHQNMKSGPKVHPYCSSWYTWPLLIRPVVYLFEKSATSSKAAALPPLPPGIKDVSYAVYGMGNPVLWWFSSLAILLSIALLLKRVWSWLKTRMDRGDRLINYPDYFPPTKELWLVSYVVINWSAHFLPWMKVTRCTFLYLYMSASVFAFLGLAWTIDRWLQSYQRRLRIMGVTAIFLVLAAFVFCLPIYLGLPLPFSQYKLRIWLSTWI